MNELEQYIRENREAFSDEEPAGGHKDRFREKLTGQPKTRRVTFRYAMQIAASLAVIIAAGIVIVKTSKSGDKMAAVNLPAEVEEARNYYVRQVNDRYEQINTYDFDSGKEKEMLLEELKEMDSYYRQLLEDLNANPGDERAIQALIHHYQMKVSVMDQIIQQLDQINTQKSTNNENSSV